MTGAALRMTWHHFFVAGAALYTDGVEKSQDALVRGRQLCRQLSIFEGSLAELSRFQCCQRRTLRKSRRIASFLMLSTSKIEDLSQTCFVFKLADRHHFPSSPLPFVTTSLSHHFPKSPHSLRHHFPKSPHSHCHHLPSSPLPLVTTSQSHHTPFVTASQSNHIPSSPPPFLTSLPHHFPKSPFP